MAAGDSKPTQGTFKDLTGKTFGRWTVVSCAGRIENTKDHAWVCRCECGTTKTVPGILLKRGKSMSCGCLYRESRHTAARTHGGTGTPEFVIWNGMKGRCRDQGNSLYHKYGAKGVTVCDRWLSFEAFMEDMGPRPSPEHSVDRIDRSKGYEPGNCRWASLREQAQNRSIVKQWTYKGETMPLIEWARRLGMGYTTLRSRIDRGWSFEDAISRRIQE